MIFIPSERTCSITFCSLLHKLHTFDVLLGKNPLQLFRMLQKIFNTVHGIFFSALSEIRASSKRGTERCASRASYSQWCSPFAAQQLPDTSTPCGLHEKHTWNIPVCNARLSASRFLSAPSYSHKFCVSCWRNRVVSGSLQLMSRYPTHISSRLHESSLSLRNKGNFAPFCLRHLCLCSLFGSAVRIC